MISAQRLQLVLAERGSDRGHGVLQTLHPGCAREGRGDRLLLPHPGKCHLRAGDTVLAGDPRHDPSRRSR